MYAPEESHILTFPGWAWSFNSMSPFQLFAALPYMHAMIKEIALHGRAVKTTT